MLEILRQIAWSEREVSVRVLGADRYPLSGVVHMVNDEVVSLHSRGYISYVAVAHVVAVYTGNQES